MDDLTAFLAARLGEDEAEARDALALWPDTHWTVDPGSIILIHFHARHDPARVLREVEAKRAILELHRPVGFYANSELSRPRYWCFCGDPMPCRTQCNLAAVYSDCPDYRPEWKP